VVSIIGSRGKVAKVAKVASFFVISPLRPLMPEVIDRDRFFDPCMTIRRSWDFFAPLRRLRRS